MPESFVVVDFFLEDSDCHYPTIHFVALPGVNYELPSPANPEPPNTRETGLNAKVGGARSIPGTLSPRRSLGYPRRWAWSVMTSTSTPAC
ncbi:hypothetical protein BE61_20230 [Bradyrhizobium elkanii USDA 61]|nr:hypothetical protein BE61_20230 [Bradyrhizobium elkanii USDA 61]